MWTSSVTKEVAMTQKINTVMCHGHLNSRYCLKSILAGFWHTFFLQLGGWSLGLLAISISQSPLATDSLVSQGIPTFTTIQRTKKLTCICVVSLSLINRGQMIFLKRKKCLCNIHIILYNFHMILHLSHLSSWSHNA